MAKKLSSLYVSSPLAGSGYPLFSLKSFKRELIKSGDIQTIHFKLKKESFMQIDENGKEFLPKGNYQITVGSSSPSKRSEHLGAAIPQMIEMDSKTI